MLDGYILSFAICAINEVLNSSQISVCKYSKIYIIENYCFVMFTYMCLTLFWWLLLAPPSSNLSTIDLNPFSAATSRAVEQAFCKENMRGFECNSHYCTYMHTRKV